MSDSTASILLLNAPENLLMGLDYCEWRIKPRFMGISSIPEGAHFIYWEEQAPPTSSSYAERLNLSSNVDSRLGCFIFLNKGEVLTWRWEPISTAFQPLSSEEHSAYADGVKHGDFLGNLAPFQHQFDKPWNDLTCFITPRIVDQIEPVKKLILSEPSMRSLKKQDEQGENNVNPSMPYGTTLFYTDIPPIPRISTKMTPHENSLEGSDTSTRLEILIKQWHGNELCLLGELQFAYISFLLGYHFDSFQQWKSLLVLLCNAERAFSKRPGLFSGFFQVFHTQLEQAPDDLFSDELLADNFLVHCIINLMEIASYPDTHTSSLHKPITNFAHLVETKYGMSVDALPFLMSDGPTIYSPNDQTF